MKLSTTLFAIGCIICGCAPYPHYEWQRPNVVGRVLDAESLKPLSGAKIIVIDEDNLIVEGATSNNDGVFNIPPYRKFYFFSYFGDLIIKETLVVTKDNYVEKREIYGMFSTSGNNAPIYPMDVLLTPVSGNVER